MDPADLDQLLERARRQEPDAFEELVRRYSQRLFGLLLRLTGSRDAAEDYVQETFLRVVRTIADYQHQGRFEAWLFRIAANLARDHARQAKRRGPTGSLDVADDHGRTMAGDLADERLPGPAAGMHGGERESRLHACLAALPGLDREVLILRHFSELSFREIADLLQIPLGTALARGHRALRRLRQELEGADGEDQPARTGNQTRS